MTRKRSTRVIFMKNKKVFNIYDIDVGKKSSLNYFFEYDDDDDDDVIRSLCVSLLQMNGYVKHFDSNKTMSCKVHDNSLLKKYTKIWGKVIILLNIEYDSEPVYVNNDKCMKVKIKSYGDKVNAIFQG